MLEWLADRADDHARMTPDADLVQAVDAWLAVSGIQGDAIERSSPADESPPLVPRRIDLQAIAADLVDAKDLLDELPSASRRRAQ